MSSSVKRAGRASLLLAACALCANSGAARAADYSTPESALRGSYVPYTPPPPRTTWDGVYFGGQAGRTFTNADFGNSSASQISYILANTELQSVVSSWQTLPSATTARNSYGGFAGFSTHWDDIVGSLELNYKYIKANAGSSGAVGPIIVPGATLANGDTVQYAVSVASTASIMLKDVLTARARAGWSYDRYLPYAFAGFTVGRADVSRVTSVSGTKSTTTPAVLDAFGNIIVPAQTVTGALILPRSPQSTSESIIGYGFSLGLGIDICLYQNLFLRAEWEYTQFPNIDDVRVNLNSVHAGLGLKF